MELPPPAERLAGAVGRQFQLRGVGGAESELDVDGLGGFDAIAVLVQKADVVFLRFLGFAIPLSGGRGES